LVKTFVESYIEEVALMSVRQKYREILSQIVPAGAAGIVLLLGFTAPGDASRQPAGLQTPAANVVGISERLAAIRQAVSDLGRAVEPNEAERQLAWGNWRNGGWRNGGWGNWRNGWGNGGWHNWWHNW
jgi:hypothetical protein